MRFIVGLLMCLAVCMPASAVTYDEVIALRQLKSDDVMSFLQDNGTYRIAASKFTPADDLRLLDKVQSILGCKKYSMDETVYNDEQGLKVIRTNICSKVGRCHVRMHYTYFTKLGSVDILITNLD